LRFHPVTDGKRRYRFNTLSTSAHMGVGGQHEDPANLHHGKTRYPFYWRISGSGGRYGKARKI
jgi:hypothetical protein